MPGGIRTDLDSAGGARIAVLAADIRRRFQPLVDLYDKTASLQDRTVATGVLRPALAMQFGAGGDVGRAAGRQCDARRWPGYAPYTELTFEIPTLEAGDVNARLWIRVREVEQSLRLIEQILAMLPGGQSTPHQTPAGRTCRVKAWPSSKASVATTCLGQDGGGRPDRPVPPARPVLVPVAAAGGGDRRQHHRRLPALQ